MTNADHIRRMSDEESAEFIRSVSDIEFDKYCRNLPECTERLNALVEIPAEDCRACVVTWLRRPKEDA